MQKLIIKGVTAEQAGQYSMVSVFVSYLPDRKKYECILLLTEKGKERAKYEASEIRILNRNREAAFKQVLEIAKIYPPRKDVEVFDLTGGSHG